MDSEGNLLYSVKILTTFEEEQKYIACIQDPEGLPCSYTVTGHKAASALVCKRHNLIGILPSPPGQVSDISIILWGILVIAIQHPLLHSSQDQEGVNMHEE